MLLLHQLFHEIKTVQTILNEDQDSESAPPSDSELVALVLHFSSFLVCSVASPLSDGLHFESS